ncbi:D-aminoacyl-tRNA deacylase [Streptomyces pactum]|uniref:D-aminoacyl-tRNA deacylase n=1 Tax=Streptomyces pactum TaxID=68249 RepID=A0ABS0NKB9_9ACTN|nr:D-aminoacyl-tRNA deacylase [Streptomyces pactum]
MRAVVQRVNGASVVVDGETVGEITGQGLCVLVGVTHDDTPDKAARLARKLWTLRILEDRPQYPGHPDGPEHPEGSGNPEGTGEGAKESPAGAPAAEPSAGGNPEGPAPEGGAPTGGGPERSCSDLDAPLLVISQFTLYGDARKGRRPTWNAAAPGEIAEPLVDEVVAQLRALGARVETGRFGARMRVSLTNDGPFTVLVEV